MNEEFFAFKSFVLDIFYNEVYNSQMTYVQAAGKTYFEFFEEMGENKIKKAIIIVTVCKRLLKHNVLSESERANINESKKIVSKYGSELLKNEEKYLLNEINILQNYLNVKDINKNIYQSKVEKLNKNWGYNELRSVIIERFYDLLIDETNSYEDVTRVIVNEFKEEMATNYIYKVIIIFTIGAGLDRAKNFSEYFLPYAKDAINSFKTGKLINEITKDLHDELEWNYDCLKWLFKKNI